MAAIVCLSSSVNSVNAQESGTPRVRVAPVVGSPVPGSQPRLGFMGEMIHGYGMRVLSTNYGSPAQLAGLERGDVIFYINGRRILCQYDYSAALQDAAMYRGGYVSLTVRNVRFDMGLSYQEFVNVSTRVIGGYAYGGGYGGPVPAYGGMPRSGSGAGQVGMAVRSAPQAGKAVEKVKEITADQVPALKEGQKGTGQ